MSGELTDPILLTPMQVWRPTEDYEIRIQGSELSAILQMCATEYEKGRAAYTLENLLDAAYRRLGEMLVYATADALKEPDCAKNAPAGSADDERRRIIRPFAA